ncbi:MAG: DUF3696 domain-containing protein [Verrucomicrobiales bacterium]|nr:DUF3696 domain-containing protein [Verrucomicrobiales bacterium]
MIHEITVANFKAFADTQRIPLRPITLIFGKNSGGKSSILHSLLLAHHAQQKGSWHVGNPVLAGTSVDLGGFHNYVHGHDDKRTLKLALECDVPPFCRTRPFLAEAKVARIEVEVAAEGCEWREDDVERRRPRLVSCSVEVDSEPLLSLHRAQDEVWRAELSPEHPAVVAFGEEVAMKAGSSDLAEIVTEMMRTLVTTADFGDVVFFPGRVSFAGDLIDSLNLLEPPGKTQSTESNAQTWAKTVLSRIMGDLFATLDRCFSTCLQQVEYLGPLRLVPDRFADETDSSDPNWVSSGASAWQVLKQNKDQLEKVNGLFEQMKVPYALEVKRIADETSILDSIQSYVRDRAEPRLLRELADLGINPEEALKLGDDDYRAYLWANRELYAAIAKHYHSVQVQHDPDFTMDDAEREVLENRIDLALPEEWAEWIIEFPEGNPKVEAIQADLSDPEAKADGIRNDIIKLLKDRRTELRLVDIENGSSVSPRDVGIGISQLIPVLVHACASRGKLIAVEQPELHLHPALQAELGDVFIESALGPNQNQFVLETHSEHLILRLLKRIRETSRNTLKHGSLPVRMEDVQILYVEPGSEGSTVRELGIDAQGRLVDNWPDGFFEERLDELF